MEIFQVSSIINGNELTVDNRKINYVRSPYSREIVGQVIMATKEDAEKAIEVAHGIFNETMSKLPAYKRSDILRNTAHLLEEQVEKFARILALEAGKPIQDGRGEVRRAVQVLKFAADEAQRMEGELVPMDAAIGGENRIGMVLRKPIGVVSAITPFNFPLNLALHKLAPAFAAGNTVIFKPAGKTPISAYYLVKLFEEAGLPKGALNLVVGNGSEIGDILAEHPLVKKVTFTGSPHVGIQIRRKAELKKVTLELGSNSPNIIFKDGKISEAVTGLVRGAFAYSGQVCISAQRIYVEKEIYEIFLKEYATKVNQLKMGDPLIEETDIGPLIDESEAIRAEQWIQEAKKHGANIVTGGTRNGSFLEPTVLINVTSDMKVVCQEAFAPIVSIIPFETEDEVISMANDSEFGLQAGVFTNDLNRAIRIANQLETGGVWINEISTYRQDNYPYGGVKRSGIGKEGVKYAIEDMTEIKFIGMKLK